MFKKIILFLFVFGFLAISLYAHAQEPNFKDSADYMSRVDQKHSKEEFQAILDMIETYYSDTPANDVGFLVFNVWTEVRKTAPKIRLFDFLARFENFILFKDGRTLDFDETLINYSRFIILGELRSQARSKALKERKLQRR